MMISRAPDLALTIAFIGLSSASTAEAQAACNRTMGPYYSQYSAEAAAQQARQSGYQTSNVWTGGHGACP